MTAPAPTRDRELLAGAAYDFVRNIHLPVFIIDRPQGVFMANEALAKAFGYDGGLADLEGLLARREFLTSHFSPEVTTRFYEMLTAGQGRLEDWLMSGWTRDGRELTLEITARGRLLSPDGPADFLEAVFMPPGNLRDADAFLQTAQKEAELAVRAKTEFLSNISHELRTPLNIIIGMLGLALEDDQAGEELRQNLALAKEAADGLFSIINDLIVLSNLEGRRLNSEPALFSPQLLLHTLTSQFSARARAKAIELRIEGGEAAETVVEGGYNLLVLALEKLVDNAIKFTAHQGQVLLKAKLAEDEGRLQLQCSVADNGPGFDDSFLDLESQALFQQGDGSMNRRHGGLGLGLRLASNLVTKLGGSLQLANRDGGGAELSFSVAVKSAAVDHHPA
ncbi:MAG: HAMP domain-containing histidine kinase [Candidatus Adiutrix sp.]|jgi:signal transduction histidine kinase|nr:HAMP domain-containing histidine kinase [Candidatus Adiutrix sp.]